jgi:hypothetical protein
MKFGNTGTLHGQQTPQERQKAAFHGNSINKGQLRASAKNPIWGKIGLRKYGSSPN